MQDDDELEAFCAEAYPRLVAALAYQVGDRWLAEELAQEALVRACDHWGKVRSMASPLGWAFRVGANLGNSWFRRRAAERRAHQRHGPARSTHHDRDAADRMAVEQSLHHLTPPQREALVLRYFLGLSADEAAQARGSSPGAVRGLTHRAVQTLRDVLDEPFHVEEDADVS